MPVWQPRLWVDFEDDLDAEALNDLEARVGGVLLNPEFPNNVFMGANPSVDLNPTNPSKWAAITFAMVTDRGGGDRLHVRSMNLASLDTPELVYRPFGPGNTAPFGPNADGTALEGAKAGQAGGRISWQGMTPQGSFQGLSASIAGGMAEDTRLDALQVTLASGITLGPATPSVITITGNLDSTPSQADGLARPWYPSGTFTIGGTTVTYSARSATKFYGCTGGGIKTAQVFIGAVADDNYLRYTARTPGAAGNSITVTYANPGTNNASLSVTVAGSAITVHLATNSSGAITTTASQINVAIAETPAADALVNVSNKLIGSSGAGVVPALGPISLTGGADSTTFSAGTVLQQTRNYSGGDLFLRCTPREAPDKNTARFQITANGNYRLGQRAIQNQSSSFFTVSGGATKFEAVPAPVVTATVVGTTGAKTITYKVVGNCPGGSQSLPGSVTISNAPTTLNDTNYVKLAWQANYGFESFDVYRSATDGTPSSTGPIAYKQTTEAPHTTADYGQAPAAINEEQTVNVNFADGGTFTLSFGADTTSALAWNLSAAALKTALEALSTIAVNEVAVTQTSDPAASGINSFKLLFNGGTLAGTNVDQVVPNPDGLTQSDDYINDWVAEKGVPPPEPNISVRTRTQGGPITNTVPTRDSTADVTIDNRLNLNEAIALAEQTAPDPPDATHGLLYVKDSGGRTKLFLKDSTGEQQLLDDATGAQPADATLTALAALSSSAGYLVQTAADTFNKRTLTGTTNRITITNGSGTLGNPVFDVGSNVYVSGGTDVAVGDGGTGASTAATARSNLGAAMAHVLDTHANRIAAGHSVGRLWKESDTGLIYYDNGTTWDIWKGDGVVLKTADETVNNSATIQNDDHLKFPVEANEIWYVDVMLEVTSVSNTSDFEAGWSLPAAATYRITRQGNSLGTATTASPGVFATTSTSTGSAAGTYMIPYSTWITVGANAGTANFQWAQTTATAEDTKVLTNSFLRIRRLA